MKRFGQVRDLKEALAGREEEVERLQDVKHRIKVREGERDGGREGRGGERDGGREGRGRR